MSAHVVVIDSTARRHNVKTTPNKHLSDVLEEVCGKLGLNSGQYSLKHNNKPVDLSRTIRLSGLSSGAKLELVQLSRSTGVVSVALQLPDSEAQGIPNARLMDKFPSTTTLWLVLRKFEAGVAGDSNQSRNLTAKGAPSTASGNTGAGRLYYQQPVIQVMGRELASLTDLQKSLAQLGFNTGSTLLRLSYRTSDIPLEEALTQIQQYFDSVSTGEPAVETSRDISLNQPSLETSSTQTSNVESSLAGRLDSEQSSITAVTSQLPQGDQEIDAQAGKELAPEIAVGDRVVSVFRPPTASTPNAALALSNDADFTPTVEHAQIHQKLLQQASMNKRLLTDAELEQKSQEEAAKLAAIKDVEIKIRFPDQSSVSAKFNQADSALDLYSFARGCLDEGIRDEAFVLRNPGMKGKNETIAQDPKILLIKNLLLKGRVLVVFSWPDNASSQARSARTVLKPALRSQAQEITTPLIPNVADEKGDAGIKVNIATKDESRDGEGSSVKKLPKWLKGLSRK